MQQVKEVLIRSLTKIVTNLFQNYFVDVYGSHATGLCLHWGDIDLVVGPKDANGDKDQSMNMNV